MSFGPLVYASIGNAIPGDTAGIAPASKAELKADLSSITPLKKAVVIKNGQILKEFELAKNEASISIEVPAEDAWYLVRVYTATTGIEAMTNPIWVKVGAPSTTTSPNNAQVTPPGGSPSSSTLPTTVNGTLRGKLHKLGLGDAFLFLVNGDKITDEILARATELWATQQPIPMTDHKITDQELMRFTLLKLLLEDK